MKVRQLKGRMIRRAAARYGVNEGIAVALRRYYRLTYEALLAVHRQERIAFTPEGYERIKNAVLEALPKPRPVTLHVTCPDTGETFVWERRV